MPCKYVNNQTNFEIFFSVLLAIFDGSYAQCEWSGCGKRLEKDVLCQSKFGIGFESHAYRPCIEELIDEQCCRALHKI